MILFLIFFLQLLTIPLWGFLVKSYSIFKYYNTPYFALDKIVGNFNSPIIQKTLLVFIIISLIYLINLFLIYKIKNKSLQIIFVSIVLFSVVLSVIIYPVAAIDIFDYIAQGKLFYFYHQNPYITNYSLYPNDIFWKFTGFLDQNLIYGPVWLLIVSIPNFLINFNKSNPILESLILYKTTNLIILLVTGFLITKLHSNKKLFYWYFFVGNPLVIFEAICNGHNDILIAMFMVIAIIYSKNKSYLTGIFIALASLVKIYFIVLIPFFLIRLFINEKYKIKNIIKSIFYIVLTIFVFYFPFIFNNNINHLISTIYNSQNMNTYSVFSLIREYLTINNHPLIHIYATQIGLLFIFLIVSTIVILKTTKNNIAVSLFIILNLFNVLITFSHPWYYIVSFAIIACSRQHKINYILISLQTLLMLCFYPLSVWLWFDSGFNIFNIHVYQSLFIVPIVILSTVYCYIFRYSRK